MLIGDRDRAVALERGPARQHLVHDDAERIDVGPFVGGRSLRLLWAEVGGGADDCPGPGQLLGVIPCAGDAEVGHFHGAVGGEEDVPRLHVAMHQTGPVGGGERGGDLGPDLGGPSRKEGTFTAKDITKAAAVDQFHDDEIGVAGLAPVVDPDDVGVGEVGGGLSLPPESLHECFVVRELSVQHLDRHFATKEGVLAEIHVGHPAAGQVRREVITLGKGVRKVHGEPAQILGEAPLHSPSTSFDPHRVISSAIH